MSTPDDTPEWKNGYNIGFEAARKRFIKQLYHKELMLKWLSKQLARLTHYDCKNVLHMTEPVNNVPRKICFVLRLGWKKRKNIFLWT